MSLPTIAIVGRPNVGKSTLLNRLAGRRVSIVHDKPGVTRDRISAEVDFGDRLVEVVDTGGIGIVDRDDLHPDIHLQIDTAIAQAQLILFVVDARDGVQPLDREVAIRLRGLEIPILLAANKCEANAAKHSIGEFYELGMGEPLAISAEHNEGIGDLESALLERLPDTGVDPGDPALKIAIVGRRNAGKSTSSTPSSMRSGSS